MDQQSFHFEICSPLKQVVTTQVTEVVLPAHDGEVGVLPGHENFVGLLGTGPLKYVSGKDDYWLMVSSGTYQVKDGALTIAAEVVDDVKEFDVEKGKALLAQLEKEIEGKDTSSREYLDTRSKILQVKARLEVNRRVGLN